MIRFNDEQYRAVTHRDGPMLVLAGPGSGKTSVIVGRVLYLTEYEHIDPGNILVLTFSKASAMEMEERFHKEASGPGMYFKDVPVSYDRAGAELSSETKAVHNVTFGTFHAIFYHILKSQGLYRSGEILTNNRKAEILKRISLRTGLKIHKDRDSIGRMIEYIGLKKTGIDRLIDEMNEDDRCALERIYDPYVRQCSEEGLLDFDDMVNECLKMLESNDKILEKWAGRYRYILVDEFQDIDERQYQVLKLLSKGNRNLFCVGDDDQSIYSFRGAVPQVMKRMTYDFPELVTVTLTLNYRCPSQVTESAYRLIRHNSLRFDKKQVCINVKEKGCIEYRCFYSAETEMDNCIDVIKGILKENADNERPHETIGILYRISYCADLIEERLRKSLIPYTRKDKSDCFYDREWVRDITAYLRLAAFDDQEALLRVLNRPSRGLSRECLAGEGIERDAMLGFYDRDDDSRELLRKMFRDIDFIKELDCFGALNYIFKGIGMDEYIKERYFNGSSEAFDDAAAQIADRSRGYGSIKEWLRAIDNIVKSEIDIQREPAEEGSFIRLMTIHGSKGLEFDNVIMIGLQEGVFPGKHCRSAEALEEERRLFYVAMTRCRKRLYMLGRRKDSYGKRESRFLAEAGFRGDVSYT